MNQEWELWLEGYVATGNRSGARYLGIFVAPTFKEACDLWGNRHANKGYYSNRGHPSYWGCRIFDNEIDARRSFG